MGKQHIIELNGQRYDALTGAIVTSTPIPVSKNIPKTPTARNMDGFSRVSKQNLPHHQPEKSKTLMRKVVNKPRPQLHATSKQALITSSATATHHHASHTHKSPLIKRFAQNNIAPLHTKTGPTPNDAPAAVAAQAAIDPLSQAVANATSHKEPKVKKPRLSNRIGRRLNISPRVVNASSFALAFLMIGSFFVYQNIPGLTMRLAATRSGVAGSIPSYQPAGFSLNGSVAYKPGQITINYKSNSDDRNFRVSQSTSAWDSQSLLDNYVAVNRRDYQTVQDKGKTVYIYEGDHATWVDGGIWYRVEGESNLSSDQLLHIAASL